MESEAIEEAQINIHDLLIAISETSVLILKKNILMNDHRIIGKTLWDINLSGAETEMFQETWWRHQMETFPGYWSFVWGLHRSPVNSPHKVFFHQCLTKLLSKQSRGWWFETPSCSLWRHRNELVPRHGCGCPGSSHRCQVISSHDVDIVVQTSTCRQGLISTTCAIYMLRNS